MLPQRSDYGALPVGRRRATEERSGCTPSRTRAAQSAWYLLRREGQTGSFPSSDMRSFREGMAPSTVNSRMPAWTGGDRFVQDRQPMSVDKLRFYESIALGDAEVGRMRTLT
jgi:hypothetical protein